MGILFALTQSFVETVKVVTKKSVKNIVSSLFGKQVNLYTWSLVEVDHFLLWPLKSKYISVLSGEVESQQLPSFNCFPLREWWMRECFQQEKKWSGWLCHSPSVCVSNHEGDKDRKEGLYCVGLFISGIIKASLKQTLSFNPTERWMVDLLKTSLSECDSYMSSFH